MSTHVDILPTNFFSMVKAIIPITWPVITIMFLMCSGLRAQQPNDKNPDKLNEIAAEKASLNDTDSAEFFYLLAAELYAEESDFVKEAGIYNTLGNLYLKTRNYPVAIEYFIKSAEIYDQKTDDRTMVNRPLINIAVVENSMGNPELALEYAQKVMDNFEEYGDDEIVKVFTQRLIGRIYRRLARYDEAIQEIKQTLPYYYALQEWGNLSETHVSLANIFYDKTDFKQANLYADSALLYGRKSGENGNLAHAMHSKGFVLMELRQMPLAQAYVDSSIMLAQQIQDPYLILDGYGLHSEIEKFKGNIEGYAKYIGLYIAQRDSIDLVSQRAMADELEAKYQNRVKQSEIEVLRLEQQLLASNILRQKNTQYGILFTLLVVVIFSIVLVNRYRALNIARRELEVEKLRNNIARDLHDDLGSTLSSINIISKMALLKDSSEVKSGLEKVIAHSSIMMDKLSDIVWSIHADKEIFDELLAKMKEFASEILEPQGISWQFDVDEAVYKLKPGIEKRKAIFLVFKESINNAAKYSGTSQIDISLHTLNGHLELRIKDHGAGFDEASVKMGNGLRNMEERAKNAGDGLSVSSIAGQGTEVFMRIPIT